MGDGVEDCLVYYECAKHPRVEEACVCVGALGKCSSVQVEGLTRRYCFVEDSVADGYLEGLEGFWCAD